MPELNGISVPFIPVGSPVVSNRPALRNGDKLSGNSRFDEVFAKELLNLKFSGHAKARIESRDLSMTTAEMQKLELAISRAREKGANESLVLMDEKAFIVNVPNNTVITVMDKDKLNQNVITNIDSAVFA